MSSKKKTKGMIIPMLFPVKLGEIKPFGKEVVMENSGLKLKLGNNGKIANPNFVEREMLLILKMN